MPLLDISRVTCTLVDLVKRRVDSYLDATSTDGARRFEAQVVPAPPDTLPAGNAIGVYLYHLKESAHSKNLPPPGSDQPPIRYTPMGLDLHYQLTAKSTVDEYNAQELMGVAVKALRDYAIIDDSTKIDGTEVLSSLLRGADNRLRIVLEPISHNEAVSFWTAGSLALRLAAYYLVSVVLLEPEGSRSRAGRVLQYGAFTFPGGPPRLEGSRNVLTFAPPGNGMQLRQVELRPAQVPPAIDAEAENDLPKNGDVDFLGSDLAGDRTMALLQCARWAEPLELDATWRVRTSSGRLCATVRRSVVTPTGLVDVLPGVHSAFVRTVRRRRLPDGTAQDFAHTSNATPFVITPRIDDVTDGADAVVTVTGWRFYFPEDPEDAEDPENPGNALDVQVYVGSAKLQQASDGVLGAGQFVIGDPGTLKLRRPDQADAGESLPLRILVNGAEAPPRWIRMP